MRIIAISNDNLETSQKTQAAFPHLVIASDPDQAMAQAFAVIQPGMGHDGTDTNIGKMKTASVSRFNSSWRPRTPPATKHPAPGF